MRSTRFGWMTMIAVGVAAWRAPACCAQQAPTTQPAAKSRAIVERSRLEAEFRRTLTNATFTGTWQMARAEQGKGPGALSPARPEKYSIADVTQLDEEYWIVNARIEYEQKDVTIPVTVRVLWAGDTPVITLDEVTLPMLGTYSARVMIYQGFYSGTWFGPDCGGVLAGQITHDEPPPAATQPAHPGTGKP